MLLWEILKFIFIYEVIYIATSKKIFTPKLQDKIFEKIKYLTKQNYKSITNLNRIYPAPIYRTISNKNRDIEIGNNEKRQTK